MSNDPSLALAPRIIDQTVEQLTAAIPAERRNLFILGLGYTGQYIATALTACGWRVGGTSRNAETRERLSAAGLETVAFGDAIPDGYDQLLSTIGPDREDGHDPALTTYGPAMLDRRFRWTGYFSATSVYGDSGDDWIEQTTDPAPETERGQKRLAIEQAWQGLMQPVGLPLSLFRLAGIYGPERNIIMQLQSGKAKVVDKPGHVFNRIHVEDITRAVLYRIANPAPLTIDNLADGQPMTQAAWVARAADMLNITAPAAIPFEQAKAKMSPMARSFWAERKLIRAPKFG